MTAFGMMPTFTDPDSYRGWMNTWRATYRAVTEDIRRQRAEVKELQRSEDPAGRRAQKNLHYQRRVAGKMMTLRDEANQRWTRIRKMYSDLAEQNAQFPLDLGVCKRVDFHFNKITIEFPQMPSWVIKTKGKTFYVRDVASEVGFSTRNKAEGNTRGLLRFPEGHIVIDAEGIAHISPVEKMVDRIGLAA